MDLTAVFARFSLDEVAHVEMAARMASELGGVTAIRYADDDVVRPATGATSLLRAAAYLQQAEVALAKRVIAPFLARAIPVDLRPLPPGVKAALAA